MSRRTTQSNEDRAEKQYASLYASAMATAGEGGSKKVGMPTWVPPPALGEGGLTEMLDRMYPLKVFNSLTRTKVSTRMGGLVGGRKTLEGGREGCEKCAEALPQALLQHVAELEQRLCAVHTHTTLSLPPNTPDRASMLALRRSPLLLSRYVLGLSTYVAFCKGVTTNNSSRRSHAFQPWEMLRYALWCDTG